MTEMVVASLLLTFVAAVAIAAIRMMAGVQKQWVLAQMQRDAQFELYGITRDIRNAYDIAPGVGNLTPSKLVLKSFNLRTGFDVAINPKVLDTTPAQLITITYEYKANNGGYLERKEEVPGDANSPYIKKILVNMLNPPTATERIFDSEPIGEPPPYGGVNVVFRLGRGFWKDAPRVYQATAVRRSPLQ
jgi:hypothetical protein